MIDLKNLKLEDELNEDVGSRIEAYRKNVENATVDTIIEDFKQCDFPYTIYCDALMVDGLGIESWQHLAVLMMLCGNKMRQRIDSVALDELFKTIDAKLRKEILGDEEDQN